ncbi:MAG: hypothetical protein JXB07_14840 [Anaerolineae bacterium]|nr:hypothetical protein [Anaerolineae bacterium]
MKSILIGIALPVILHLTACGTLVVEGEIIKVVDAPQQQVELFLPDLATSMAIDQEWDFGARLDFSSRYEISVSLLAFWLYPDESLSLAGSEACLDSNAQIPLKRPDRHSWSTGIEILYPPGEHTFEQIYHYPGVSDGIPGSMLVMWLIQRQDGQIIRCSARQYTLVSS